MRVAHKILEGRFIYLFGSTLLGDSSGQFVYAPYIPHFTKMVLSPQDFKEIRDWRSTAQEDLGDNDSNSRDIAEETRRLEGDSLCLGSGWYLCHGDRLGSPKFPDTFSTRLPVVIKLDTAKI